MEGKISQQRLVRLGVALVALTVIGALVSGLWRQIRRLQELEAAEAELVPLNAREKQRNEELHQQLENLSSPDYLEEWARIHGGMTLPGEVRVVVSLPEDPAEPPPSAPPAQSPPSFWQGLWQLLFDPD